MADQSANNKRIAKNTIALYFRMIVTTLVSLYTSRVVLNTLGVEDYGLYGVVGGVVTMFSFLKATMSGATSRFLTFSLGKGDQKDLDDTFSTSLIIHFGIAVVILILAETVGLWFIECKLSIPDGRMTAARWVYQFSVLSMMVTVTQVPYNASIISHERMGIYAYVELLYVVLKLLVVYLLLLGNFDRLIFYAALIFGVNLLIATIYRVYCVKRFSECHFRFVWKKEKIVPMLTFSGWDLYGNMAYTFKQQGINMLINMFFGVVYNAASSVANNVQGVVSNLAVNVIQAFRPQIVKSYAADDLTRMETLMYNGIKFSLLLFMLLTIPIILETQTILSLWLGIVPDGAVGFCRILLVVCLFNLINRILGIGIQATGQMKYVSLITGTIHLLCLPAIYVLFKYFVNSPIWAYLMAALTMLMVDASNMIILKKQVPQLRLRYYLKGIFQAILIALVASLPVIPIYCMMQHGWVRLVCLCLAYGIALCIVTFLLGLNSSQRAMVKNFVSKKFHHKK